VGAAIKHFVMPALRGHPVGSPAVIMTHKTRGHVSRPPAQGGGDRVVYVRGGGRHF